MIVKKTSLILSTLLILFAGGVYAENSDKEFTCDLKDTILSTDLINGEKTTSESFSTWRVKVNISEEKLLFGRGGYLRGCGPLNDSFRLTISESQLLCQEEYEGKVRYEGGIKKSKSESGDFIFNNLEYPVSVTFDRYSLRFTRQKGSKGLTVHKEYGSWGHLIDVESSGICKEEKRKF